MHKEVEVKAMSCEGVSDENKESDVTHDASVNQ